MSAYQVAVVEDEAAPLSGSAVIRIEGLSAWPQGATVRLVPIDEAAVPPLSDGWPWGELIPARVIPTSHGIDVLLGPEIVSSPKLVPGTPITIKVGAANLEVDARWPAISPTTRRRTGAVAMSANQLLAAKAERERAEKDAAARRQELAEAAARSVREATAVEAKGARGPASADATQLPSSNDTGHLARLLPLRRSSPATGPADPTITISADQSQLARLTPYSATNVAAVPQQRRVAARTSPSAWRGFAAGLVSMGTVALGLALFAPKFWNAAPIGPVTLASVGEQIPVANLDRLFKDLAATGVTSPRRKSAANVDVATALSLADHSLRGTRTPAELEEAEFWLKRAVATSIGGAEVGWAMTQLGTIYAQSAFPQHSYAKAQALWQLAAAQGDPVAHCFLGALYEHGLGVTASRSLAREHYSAADAANACKSAKDAAARLKD
jgi:TPR repeat protein